jgi:hypothetical protein
MSNTRRAKDNSQFYQSRYASSAEFERGLLANLVAKRVSILDDKTERELIWFIHYLSHQEGGLIGLADDLIKRFPDQNRDKNIPGFDRDAHAELEDSIKRLCLDPSLEFKKGFTWFNQIGQGIKQYQAQYIKTKAPAFTTELGKKISDVLDYTAFCRGLTLIEGEARIGKSFAARAWCEQRPGIARLVEVATGNDDAGFFRTLARGLGLGMLSRYKVCDIKDRVENVLLSGDLILVLDEAHRLWPQRNLRSSFPGRIVWVMNMANAGVPIAMVSTPQFIATQKAIEKHGWNSAQLTGRIKHYEPLPAELSQSDLKSVAKSVLPEASDEALRAIVVYARSSARYLAAIDSISARARYLAMKHKRDTTQTADVIRAMKESVIPADSKLQVALAQGQKNKHPRLVPPGPLPEQKPVQRQTDFAPTRERSTALAAQMPETQFIEV